MRYLAGIIAVFSLTGCLQAADDVGDTLARDTAKDVVNATVKQKFPGVNIASYTDCIIDNASGAEILTLAQSAVLGTTRATGDLVVDIAQRPDTISCIARDILGIQ